MAAQEYYDSFLPPEQRPPPRSQHQSFPPYPTDDRPVDIAYPQPDIQQQLQRPQPHPYSSQPTLHVRPPPVQYASQPHLPPHHQQDYGDDAYPRPPSFPPRPPLQAGALMVPSQNQRSHSEPPPPALRSESRSPSSSQERRHRRHHHHHRHHGHHRSRSRDSRSRSSSSSRERDRSRGVDGRERSRRKVERKHSTADTFIGAFSGGAIGDLIFPGLGTLGGAILGGLGGHEVGKTAAGEGGRRGRGYKDKYDREWEEGRRRRGEI